MRKKEYFTQKNIGQKSRQMLDDLLQQHRRRDVSQLASSALLVLDMQNWFLDENSHAFVPSAPAILGNIQQLIKLYHILQFPVIFTRHTNTNENAGNMKTWWRDLISPDSPLSEIHNFLETSNAAIIEKHQYDAFYNTDLHQLLQEQQIAHLAVCGVMTHLCCETTIRSAFMLGYQSWFVLDGTATYNQTLHQGSFLGLMHGFTTPVLSKEIIEELFI